MTTLQQFHHFHSSWTLLVSVPVSGVTLQVITVEPPSSHRTQQGEHKVHDQQQLGCKHTQPDREESLVLGRIFFVRPHRKCPQNDKGSTNNIAIIKSNCCSKMCFLPLSSELSADLQLKGTVSDWLFPTCFVQQINLTAIKLLLESFYEQQMMYSWHERPKASQRQRATGKLSPQESQRRRGDKFFRLPFPKLLYWYFQHKSHNKQILLTIRCTLLQYSINIYLFIYFLSETLMRDKRQNSIKKKTFENAFHKKSLFLLSHDTRHIWSEIKKKLKGKFYTWQRGPEKTVDIAHPDRSHLSWSL